MGFFSMLYSQMVEIAYTMNFIVNSTGWSGIFMHWIYCTCICAEKTHSTYLICVYVCVNSCCKCHRELACRGAFASEMSCYMGKKLAYLTQPLHTRCTHLSPGYMIMSHRAADTFITSVVIRNKPHYTQRLWFMINIHKGCGGSSSPSNPLISLNKKNRAGKEGGGAVWWGKVCVGCGAAGTFRSWHGKWDEGDGKSAIFKAPVFPGGVNCLWNFSQWLH